MPSRSTCEIGLLEQRCVLHVFHCLGNHRTSEAVRKGRSVLWRDLRTRWRGSPPNLALGVASLPSQHSPEKVQHRRGSHPLHLYPSSNGDHVCFCFCCWVYFSMVRSNSGARLVVEIQLYCIWSHGFRNGHWNRALLSDTPTAKRREHGLELVGQHGVVKDPRRLRSRVSLDGSESWVLVNSSNGLQPLVAFPPKSVDPVTRVCVCKI